MTKEQEAQQAQTVADHAAFVAEFKDFASEPRNELSKQSEEILESKLKRAEKSLIDSQAQKIAEQEKEIERLSKRGVKKYSQEELRAAFEAQPVETVFPARNQEHIIGKVALHAWIECARFLGALEESSKGGQK